MTSRESRKRSHPGGGDDTFSTKTKHRRLELNPTSSNDVHSQNSFLSNNSNKSSNNDESSNRQDSELLSVEDMLSLPLDFLLQTSPSSLSQQRNKPLLSRNEAQCFLQVQMLAQELDSLIKHASMALEQIHFGQAWLSKNGRYSSYLIKYPYLRPLRAVLQTILYEIPVSSLQRISQALDAVVQSFKVVQSSIRNLSEQNYNLADALADSGVAMAREKRLLSDLQDEVCQRIDIVVDDANVSTAIPSNNNNDDLETAKLLPTISMQAFCNKLFECFNVENNTTNINSLRIVKIETIDLSCCDEVGDIREENETQGPTRKTSREPNMMEVEKDPLVINEDDDGGNDNVDENNNFSLGQDDSNSVNSSQVLDDSCAGATRQHKLTSKLFLNQRFRQEFDSSNSNNSDQVDLSNKDQSRNLHNVDSRRSSPESAAIVVVDMNKSNVIDTGMNNNNNSKHNTQASSQQSSNISVDSQRSCRQAETQAATANLNSIALYDKNTSR